LGFGGPEFASFEWGWDAFAAIGTIALAFGTVVLALSTRGVAKASAEDVRAQWRPVVVPGSEVDVQFEEDFEVMAITVRNVGRGAAYYVDVALGVDGIYWPLMIPPQAKGRSRISQSSQLRPICASASIALRGARRKQRY
jgi:hypothetical protein